MSEPTPQRYAPIALWRVASRLMITLFNLFGEPNVLAFQHTIVRREYKLILNWLRCVETLFRKLLLIEASYCARPITQMKPRTRAKRQRREMTFFPDKPDEWRVTFRVLDRAPSRVHRRRSNAVSENARAPYLAPTTFHSAWPLAERFEALLRVHNDPTLYAKRLARRLYAEPTRIDAIVREPPELRHRIDPEPHAALTNLLRVRSPTFSVDTT